MSTPYHEIVLAPTCRAKCGCKAKHPIAMGELKLVSWYMPRGRNHLESTSKALVCIPKKMAQAILDGKTDAGLEVIDHTTDLAEPAAHAAVKAIAEAIAAGKEVDPVLRTFRQAPPPKPRAPKRPAPEAEPEPPAAPVEKRKCAKCTVNFARAQEEGSTCNGCRDPNEKAAEAAAAEAAEEAAFERKASIETKIDDFVASLPTNCPCGNRARRWRSFQSFLDGLEGKMTEASLIEINNSEEKEDAHLDLALAKYKVCLDQMLETDPLCNACAAKAAEAAAEEA